MAAARYWIALEPADEDLATHVVAARDLRLPRRVIAQVMREAGSPSAAQAWPLLTMEIQLRGGRPLVRQLLVGAAAGPGKVVTLAPSGGSAYSRGPVTSELLREIPVSRLARYATLGVVLGFGEGSLAQEITARLLHDKCGLTRIGSRDGEGGVGLHVVDSAASRRRWTEYLDLLQPHVEESKAKRRGRITDDLLQRVSRVYRRAIEEGRPPNKAVQAAEGVSEPTAGRYIHRARQRGYLGKTTRGKKGESRG